MKKQLMIFSLLLMFAVSLSAQTWNIDPAHTQIGFTVKHMVVTKVSGKFNEFSGTVDFNEKDVTKSKIAGIVKVSSIDTDNEKRDNHLRSDDFFNAEQFPEINFVSKKISKKGDGYVVTGDLTIRDVTKEITLDMQVVGPITDPWGSMRIGIEGSGVINRQDFGVKWNKAMDNGGVIVSDDVVLNLHAELVKK